VGSPRIAILDELTTGLDPQARRDTWELITRMREHGVTVVLISHFMEEVERLCTSQRDHAQVQRFTRLCMITRGRFGYL
jgi:ABC-type multidrug transport system ATPase subunit